MLELNRIRSPVSSSTGLSVTRGLDHHGARLDSDVALAGGRCARPAERRARRSRRRTTRRTRRLRPSAPPGRRSPPRPPETIHSQDRRHEVPRRAGHPSQPPLRQPPVVGHIDEPQPRRATNPTWFWLPRASTSGRRRPCRVPPCGRGVPLSAQSGGRRGRGRARANGRVVRAAFGASAERSARKSVVPVIDLWSSDG